MICKNMGYRIKLIECDSELLGKVVHRRGEVIMFRNVVIPEIWPLEPEVYKFFLSEIESDHSLKGWLGYIGVDRGRNILVGDCGFLGKPDHFGKVEIGYSVLPEERGAGIASEMVEQLVSIGLKRGASSIVARTSVTNTSSIRVMEKCGFEQYKRKFCPEEGEMIFWKRGK